MKPDDIEPITVLKRDAASLIERATEHGAPIIITQNGRAIAVLQDITSFAAERRAFALVKLAVQGEREIIEGRAVPYGEHRKRTRALLRQATRSR